MGEVDRVRVVFVLPAALVALIDEHRQPGQSRTGYVTDLLLGVLAPLDEQERAAVRRSATVQPIDIPSLPPGPPLLTTDSPGPP